MHLDSHQDVNGPRRGHDVFRRGPRDERRFSCADAEGPRGESGRFGRHGGGGHGGSGHRGGRGEGDSGGSDERGHHHGRGRDGAGRRVLGRGELPLVILALLSETPRHGYEIIRCIETRCMGAYAPSAGVIYPTLTMLEEQELTQADPTSEAGKRRYAITEAGRQYISEQQEAIQDAFARMDQAARMRARAALPASVAQAMEALKKALFQHGASWDDLQDTQRVTDIIETAAAALGTLPAAHPAKEA